MNKHLMPLLIMGLLATLAGHAEALAKSRDGDLPCSELCQVWMSQKRPEPDAPSTSIVSPPPAEAENAIPNERKATPDRRVASPAAHGKPASQARADRLSKRRPASEATIGHEVAPGAPAGRGTGRVTAAPAPSAPAPPVASERAVAVKTPAEVTARQARPGAVVRITPSEGTPAADPVPQTPEKPAAGPIVSTAPAPASRPAVGSKTASAPGNPQRRAESVPADRLDPGGGKAEHDDPHLTPGTITDAKTDAKPDGLMIKVGLVTAVDDTTAVNFAVTNKGTRPLTMLIIRCNALSASGAASGQAFDALHNVDAGETVYGQALFLKQTIAPRSTFSCRDEGLSQ